jgi:hypothetical protein
VGVWVPLHETFEILASGSGVLEFHVSVVHAHEDVVAEAGGADLRVERSEAREDGLRGLASEEPVKSAAGDAGLGVMANDAEETSLGGGGIALARAKFGGVEERARGAATWRLRRGDGVENFEGFCFLASVDECAGLAVARFVAVDAAFGELCGFAKACRGVAIATMVSVALSVGQACVKRGRARTGERRRTSAEKQR